MDSRLDWAERFSWLDTGGLEEAAASCPPADWGDMGPRIIRRLLRASVYGILTPPGLKWVHSTGLAVEMHRVI